MNKKYAFILGLYLYASLGIAQVNNIIIPNNNPLKSGLDSVVHASVVSYLSQPARVGLSVGIYRDNTLSAYHYGSTQKKDQQLPNNRTVYEIGSITKTFTGTLLAQAVKDKKVNLDDDVRLYLDGEYPNLEYNGHPIRLSHLVSHISGLPRFLPNNSSMFQNSDPDSVPFVLTRILNDYSRQRFFEDLRKVKIDTIPGFTFKYSNSSPQLLKYILERVYQKSYAELLETFILKPLKMNNTTSVYRKNKVSNVALGYNGKGNPMPYIPENLDASGGIFSTIPDMMRYLKFHMAEENEVVSLSHQITFGDLSTYALGLNWQQVLTKNNYRKIWQSGGTFGFSSYGVLYPDLDLAIIILTNEADNLAQSQLGQIADVIFEYVIDQN